MAMDFPASPTVGQAFTSGAVTYVWNGTGWAVQATSGAYVLKAGDTMTGGLVVNAAAPQLRVTSAGSVGIRFETAAGANQVVLNGFKNSLARWSMAFPTTDLESGSNVGSNLAVLRYDDAGNLIDSPFSINRQSGVVTGNGLVNSSVQTLTVPQQTQTRANVYAAPFDAMSYNGMQFNGSMDVSQENGTTQIALGAGKYVVDGWQIFSNGVQAAYGQAVGTSMPGITRALQIQVNPANPSPAAADYVQYQHRIEGYRIARLAWGTANAAPITIAFWILAVRPGTYSGCVGNNAINRSYAFTFTINAGSTWEYKVITIPGDTTGTWATDNTIGIRLIICMMCSSTYQTAPNVWTAGNFVGATGTINGAAAATDIMQLSSVVVLPGVEAPNASRSLFIMRPFDQELQTSKRYWQSIVCGWTAWCGDGNSYPMTMPFPVNMRVAPTLDASNMTAPGTGGNIAGYPQYSAQPNYFGITLASGGAKICGASGFMKLDARL